MEPTSDAEFRVQVTTWIGRLADAFFRSTSIIFDYGNALRDMEGLQAATEVQEITINPSMTWRLIQRLSTVRGGQGAKRPWMLH